MGQIANALSGRESPRTLPWALAAGPACLPGTGSPVHCRRNNCVQGRAERPEGQVAVSRSAPEPLPWPQAALTTSAHVPEVIGSRLCQPPWVPPCCVAGELALCSGLCNAASCHCLQGPLGGPDSGQKSCISETSSRMPERRPKRPFKGIFLILVTSDNHLPFEKEI